MRPAGSEDSPVAAATPVVIGVGMTGLRIVTRLAEREGRSLRCIAVFPDSIPGGPTPVPAIAWPESADAASRDLRERLDGATGLVIALSLASPAAGAVASEIAREIRPCVSNVAAVGVAPFSFEGPERTELAEAAVYSLASIVDLLAVAERERVRAITPSDTPLDRACAVVDEIAAAAAGVLARTVSRRPDLEALFGRSAVACSVGAAEATGEGALVSATRAALERSLLSPEALGASRGAFLSLAMSRTPTLGELGEAEKVLTCGLPRGASAAVGIATDSGLGGRALAAVCCPLESRARAKHVFPAEDPETLAIPAFLRRRRRSA